MARRPKRLQQQAWDPTKVGYADLTNPEWVTMSRLPAHFWSDPQNHVRYMKWLAIELGIEKLDDWYKTRHKDFQSRHGGYFLSYYENSHIKALQHFFPRHQWLIWRFHPSRPGFWPATENRKAYLAWFEKKVGIKQRSDWYRFKGTDLVAHDGQGLFWYYNCSFLKLLRTEFPDYEWLPWLLHGAGFGFWRKKTNRVMYLKWLEKQLHYEKPDDWYKVTKMDFFRNSGGSLMMLKKFKLVDLIRELYPNRQWLPWKFKQVYQGYWTIEKNRLLFLNWLEEQLGYSKPEDWYQVKLKDIVKHGGGNLIYDFYDSDLQKMLGELYPRRKWLPWKFPQVPIGFWDDQQKCGDYLNWLIEKLGLNSDNGWYSIHRKDIRANHGGGFIRRFRTLYAGLRFAFPTRKWLPWMFEKTPDGFWAELENREQFFQWLGKQLGYKTVEQWQQLTAEILRINRGHSLIKRYSMKVIIQEASNTL